MSFLEINNLTKNYGGKTVLNNISMSVNRGEVYSIIGPSGAGKSTLLRIINLLEEPSSGEVVFDGIKTSGLSAKGKVLLRRRMALFSQKVVLFNMSVFGNVAYGLNLRKTEWTTVKEKVIRTLRLVNLSRFERQNALLLSGGEAQRVALARCIVLEPELLLLDEPTANLDPPSVALMEELIKEMNEKKNTTIVIATHNMLQAKRLGTRVGFILNGELIEEGEPKNIFTRPQDERTRAFVEGTMIY